MRNRIINGAMVIDQRNAGAAVTADASYPVDRFLFRETTDGTASAQQSSTAPTGFVNSLLFTVTGTDSSLSTNQYAAFQHRIEGFNTADLMWGTANAKTVTLSFWVRSSVTGTFGGSLSNSAANRSYPFSYTINAANTWEYETITIAGDTSGTWLTTNGIGIQLNLTMAAASNLLGTANTWAGSFLIGVTGDTNLHATNGATIAFSGVQLEVGTQATSFEYRQYTTELQLCQRYYYVLASQGGANKTLGTGFYANASRVDLTVTYKTSMRAVPTLVQVTGAGYYNIYANNAVDAFNGFSGSGELSTEGAGLYTLSDVSGTSGFAGAVYTANTSAYIAFQAEL
jgi:hypothetical protein